MALDYRSLGLHNRQPQPINSFGRQPVIGGPGRGTSLGQVAEYQAKGLNMFGNPLQPSTALDRLPENQRQYLNASNAFTQKYSFKGLAKKLPSNIPLGLGFDPYKVPDDELTAFLNLRVPGIGIRGITEADKNFGLQAALEAGDLTKVRESLVSGGDKWGKENPLRGGSSFFSKIAPIALAGLGFAGGLGLPGLSIASRIAGGINTLKR